jgi:hypothetical protein
METVLIELLRALGRRIGFTRPGDDRDRVGADGDSVPLAVMM